MVKSKYLVISSILLLVWGAILGFNYAFGYHVYQGLIITIGVLLVLYFIVWLTYFITKKAQTKFIVHSIIALLSFIVVPLFGKFIWKFMYGPIFSTFFTWIIYSVIFIYGLVLFWKK